MQVMLPSAKQRRMKDLDNVTLPLITNGLYNLSGDKSNMYQSMACIITHPHRISRSCNASVCGQTISAATLGASTIRITHQSSPHHHLIHPPTHAQPSIRTGTAADVIQANHLRCLSRRPHRAAPSPRLPTKPPAIMESCQLFSSSSSQ